jgi:uncharacterized protein YkwD
MVKNIINRISSITIVIALLVTAAILTVQPSSMLQISYGGETTEAPPPAGDEETTEAPPPAGDEETTEAPPPAGDEETTEAPPATETPPPAAPPAGGGETRAAPPATGPTLELPSDIPEEAPYVVNKNSSAYLIGYNDGISSGFARACLSSFSNTSSAFDDCASGYSDGLTKLLDPTFQQSADFVKGMLAAHNRERHLVGLPDLVWDKELAAGSKAWAEHLSPTGQLVHDYGHVEAENIVDQFGPGGWILEKDDIQKKYQGGPVSQFIESLSQDERATAGHYLNMISPNLIAVGCGTAANPNPIMVCRFSTGNLDIGLLQREGIAQAPGQGAPPATNATAPATNATAPPPAAAVGEEQNTLCQNLASSLCHDDQGAPPAAPR